METRINNKGYEVLKQRDRNHDYIVFHRLMAESFFHGDLPKGNHIHHLDENPLNNEPWNLMVCSPKQHKTTHQRLDAKKACGHEDWRICWHCKQYDNPKNMYLSPSKRTSIHRKCTRKLAKERYHKDKEKYLSYQRKYLNENKEKINERRRELYQLKINRNKMV